MVTLSSPSSRQQLGPAIDVRIKSVIAHATLFEGLDTAVCDRIAKSSMLCEFRGGGIICREGERGTGLHIVAGGQVKLLLRGVNGNEKVFDLIGPGDCFGEPSLYTDQPHMVTAEAIVDTAVLHVARADLLREIREAPDLALRVIRSLAQRIYRRTGDLKGYMLMSGTQRVICYLLHELPFEAEQQQEFAVTLPVRKGLIASRLNLTQEHFSRILHELAAAALIKVDGQRVSIRDLTRLRAWAVG
jgi:CRP/FNR family transcriptional regulator, dissimilatory nitrate respiration regulator